MGQVANFWDPLISAIFLQKKILKINVNFFIGYNLLVRKMKKVLLNNFVSNPKEFITFSKKQGQILEAHVGFATRSDVFGPLWKSLCSGVFSSGSSGSTEPLNLLK